MSLFRQRWGTGKSSQRESQAARIRKSGFIALPGHVQPAGSFTAGSSASPRFLGARDESGTFTIRTVTASRSAARAALEVVSGRENEIRPLEVIIFGLESGRSLRRR